MPPDHREPSRLPVRGTVAAVGTAGALALLLSFRGGPLAPSEPATAATDVHASATEELIAAAATESSAAEISIEPAIFTGEAYSTRWGDVQVEVTLEGADITEVVALQLPEGDRHTRQVSAYVEPILREEAVSTDSAAGLSVISGATYTSKAYAASLQSALDQADPATADASMASEPADAVAEEAAEPSDSGSAPDQIRTASGDVVSMRWGDVQVAVTVQGDDIIDVEAVRMPSGDRRTDQYSEYVEPILREEAIAADSADISVISGATYTSEAYAASLQSALDQLGL